MMVDRSGEERLTALPRPSVDSAAGGLDPDVVAQLFGRTAATPNGARHDRTQPRRRRRPVQISTFLQGRQQYLILPQN